jgi:hypothetical protein
MEGSIMGHVRHGSATTTHAVRTAIQRSQASLAQLSRELGINPKTVAKWRKRATVEDMKTGPTEPRSTVLTEAEEAIVVAFRRHTLLPLDDCLYALQPSIPHLTRSALHRCLQRHGISRLPDVGGDKPKRAQFKRYPIGFFHIDIAEVQTAEGKPLRLIKIIPLNTRRSSTRGMPWLFGKNGFSRSICAVVSQKRLLITTPVSSGA